MSKKQKLRKALAVIASFSIALSSLCGTAVPSGAQEIPDISGLAESTEPTDNPDADEPQDADEYEKAAANADEDGFVVDDNGVLTAYTGSAKEVVIPAKVKEIADNVFFYNSTIEKLSFVGYYTKIGAGAFRGCKKLTEVLLPETLTEIGAGAFMDCDALTSVKLPKSLTTAGYGKVEWVGKTPSDLQKAQEYALHTSGSPFAYCEALTTVTFENGIETIPDNILRGVTAVTSVSIPQSVKAVGNHAFDCCEKLAELELPENCAITSIGEYAFSHCAAIESFTMPDKLEMLGSDAFSYCTKLSEVHISEKLEKLPMSVFGYCTSLSEITIPDNITKIDGYVFIGCTALTKITIPKTVTEFGRNVFQGCTSLETCELPDGLTSIPVYTFDGCTALTFPLKHLPATVTSIGECAFRNCTSLGDIDLSAYKITSVGQSAFRGCTSIRTVKINKGGRTDISESAFEGCTGLTEITLPTVIHIGNRAFYGDTALTTFKADKFYNIGNSAFEGCTSFTGFELDKYRGGSLGTAAFKNCSSLTSFDVSSNVKSIPKNLFSGCTSLKELFISKAVTSIDKTALDTPGVTTIIAASGSYAETFASDNGYTFKAEDRGLSAPVKVTKNSGENEYTFSWKAVTDCTELYLCFNFGQNIKIDGENYAFYDYANVLGKESYTGVLPDYAINSGSGLSIFMRGVRNGHPIDTTSEEYTKLFPTKTIGKPTVTGKRSGTNAELSWGSLSGVSGYTVYVYQNGSPVYLGETTTTKFTAAGLKAATDYTFGVQAYYKSGSFCLYGEISPVKVTRNISEIKLNENKMPKTRYKVGESLDLTGGELIVVYDDGSEAGLSMTANGVTNSGFSSTAKGSRTVTFTYQKKTVKLTVTVAAVTGIAIAQKPAKLTYLKGEDLNVTGGKITVTYSDSLTETIDLTLGMCSGYTKTKLGEQDITVKYEGKTASFKVKVEEKAIKEIYIKDRKKKYYFVGEPFDYTDGVLHIDYSQDHSGQKNDLKLNDADIEMSGFSSAKAGTCKVKLTYAGVEYSFEVSIKKVDLLYFETNPTNIKSTYYIGDKFDLTGGSFKFEFTDGTSDIVPFTDPYFTFKGFDSSKEGVCKCYLEHKYIYYENTKTLKRYPIIKDTYLSGDYGWYNEIIIFDKNALFVIGRDNNSYPHGDIGRALLADETTGKAGYCFKNNRYFEAFKGLATNGELSSFTASDKNPYTSWGGSCYGASMTMFLANKNLVALSDISNTLDAMTYYNMGSPASDMKLLDTIQYFMESQNLSKVGRSSAGDNHYYNQKGNRSSINTVLSSLVKELSNNKGIYILGYHYNYDMFYKEIKDGDKTDKVEVARYEYYEDGSQKIFYHDKKVIDGKEVIVDREVKYTQTNIETRGWFNWLGLGTKYEHGKLTDLSGNIVESDVIVGSSDEGHEVIITGFKKISNNEYHVQIYDLNHRYSFQTMKIYCDSKGNYSLDYYIDGNHLTNDNTTNLEFFDVDYIKPQLIAPITGSRTRSAKAAFDEAETEVGAADHAYISFPSTSYFGIKNDEGKYLVFDGCRIYNDMQIYDVLYPENSTMRYIVEIDNSQKFELFTIDGCDADIHIYTDDEFVCVKGEKIDSAQIALGSYIVIKGAENKDYSFTSYLSATDEETGKYGLVSVSGSAKDNVIVKSADGKVSAVSPSGIDSVTVTNYDGGEAVSEVKKDHVKDITADTETGKTETDTGISEDTDPDTPKYTGEKLVIGTGEGQYAQIADAAKYISAQIKAGKSAEGYIIAISGEHTEKKAISLPKSTVPVVLLGENGAKLTLTSPSIKSGSPLTIDGVTVQAAKAGKYVKVSANSDLTAYDCIFGNTTVKGKARLTGVTVNGSLKLSAKADKTYAATDTLKNVTITKKVTSNNSIEFIDCPSIGAVTAKGNVTITGDGTKAVSVTAKAGSGTTSVENLTLTKKISVKSILEVNGTVSAGSTVSAAGIGSAKGAKLITTGLSVSKSGLTDDTKAITLTIVDKKGSVVSFKSGKAAVKKFKGRFDPALLTLDGQTLTQKSGKLYLD